MKKIIIFIFICIFSSSIGAKENQSVWGKEEKTDTEKCQIAIEEGVSVKIKTSKSLERTAYFFDGSFFMLSDYNEFIICFRYSKKDLKLK